MESQFSEFVARQRASAEPLIVEAVEALEALERGAVSFSTLSLVPCADIARIYSVRAGIATSRGRHEFAAACQRLAARCASDPTAACRIWVLDGPTSAFALFELTPGDIIAGGFRFPGPIAGKNPDGVVDG